MKCILGADFIQKSGLVLNLLDQHVYFKFNRRVLVPLADSDLESRMVREVDCSEEQSKADPLSHLR